MSSTTTVLTDKLDEIASIKASIYSAIIDKGGTFASGTDLSDYPAAIRTIGKEPNWILAVKQSTSSNPYTLTQSDLQDIVTLSGVSYGMKDMFFGKYFTSGCLKITEPFAVTQTDCWKEAFMNSHGLGKVDLSGLTAITGDTALGNAFRESTGITEVDMSSLTSVSYYGMYYAFYGCSGLAKVDLSSATYTTQTYSWYYTFNSCSNLTEMTVNPDVLRNASSYSNPCGSATYLTTLRFSQNAVRNVYINWQTRLTKDSITGILQHLGTPVDSNQSCNFSGYSFEEDLGSELYTAYSSALEKGWVINGLDVTIKDITIITPASKVLLLKNSNQIVFDSTYAWTASVDDPNITLSEYSGQPGKSITLTVSYAQDWDEYANITITGLLKSETIECLYDVDYLTFTAEQANSTIKLSRNSGPTLYLEYSTDNANTWSNYSIGSTITLSNIGDNIKFRGTNQRTGTGLNNYNYFTMTGKIAASGSIMTLLDPTDSLRSLSERDHCFVRLFTGCASLVSAPKLPATTLGTNCYRVMFEYCSDLLETPELPAEAMTEKCYGGMFEHCPKLAKAKPIHGISFGTSCLEFMFNDCPLLKEITVSFTSWPSSSTTMNWVAGVSSSGTFYCPSALPQTHGINYIPANWTVINN